MREVSEVREVGCGFATLHRLGIVREIGERHGANRRFLFDRIGGNTGG